MTIKILSYFVAFFGFMLVIHIITRAIYYRFCLILSLSAKRTGKTDMIVYDSSYKETFRAGWVVFYIPAALMCAYTVIFKEKGLLYLALLLASLFIYSIVISVKSFKLCRKTIKNLGLELENVKNQKIGWD